MPGNFKSPYRSLQSWREWREAVMGKLGYVYPFALADATFAPNMAVRAGQAAFDASPIFQGDWDGTGTPDAVSFPRGDLLGNQTEFFYANLDPYQGSISFWITPEWNGGDGIGRYLYDTGTNASVLIRIVSNELRLYVGNQNLGVSTAAWTAGTTYHVVMRWDTRNTLDGTNYACISVNDAATFGMATRPAVPVISAIIYFGMQGATPLSSIDAQIGGFVISRVPFYDGTYGHALWFDATGPIDVINAIWAAGAGADPATIFGSWDVTAFLPTDQTQGVLQTTGQMWSHPHGSELIDVPFVSDGGLPGTDYAVEFDGAATWINCNSGATLDDLGAAGATFQVEIWFRLDDASASTFTLAHKGAGLTNGWVIYIGATGILTGYVPLAGTNAQAEAGTAALIRSGKWHHALLSYNDTTKSLQMALDGIWGAADVGAGAYQSDAASNWEFGRLTNLSSYFDGAIAWSRVWAAATYAPGTDFVADRTFSSVGTVEAWIADEGTGATIAASITSPANDGTITSGTWSAIWAIVGTPVVPQSVEFFQENDGIDFGSGANIDDLPSADCTIEFYAMFPEDASLNLYPVSKSSLDGTTGWRIIVQTNKLRCIFLYDTNDADVDCNIQQDGKWHHYAYDWDQGTLTLRSFSDGVLDETDTAVGNYLVDNAQDLLINGRGAIGTLDTNFAIGWIRLSDIRRYTGNSFIPDARTNPPANDGNAHLLVNMDDGAGATATDTSGNGYNGTITFGATTRWNNTPDLSIDEPGRMIYNGGYNIGSDGANDGIAIPTTLVAATDHVLRVPMTYSPNAWPRLTFYDVTGVASLVDFDAPPLTGVHSGANNSATLIVAGEVFPASLIGSALYNVTDGSSTVITAVGGTNQDTVTGVLAGGTDDDWDTNDVYYIVPYAGWMFNEPIVRRSAATTPYEVRVTNRNSLGVMTIHQCECLTSLLDNGDHESLTGGNPDLITGWTNSGLDAGDTEAEAAVIHSGAQSLEWNVGAQNEGMYFNNLISSIDKYLSIGMWAYGDGAVPLAVGGADPARLTLQYTTATQRKDTDGGNIWALAAGAWRVKAALAERVAMYAAAGLATGDRWSDDVYAFECDDITLTVTPASAANSLEGTGIRVDGRDGLTVPAAAHRMRARSGGIKWRATPRHDLALAQGFGQASEYLLDLTEDVNNYLRLVRTTNLLTLAVNQNGAGEVTDTDATAWAADTEVLIEVRNTGTQIRVRRDGVQVLELAGLAGFAADFTAAAYFNSEDTPSLEGDGVVSPP